VKNKTVLLVDDEKKVLFLLTDALENQGFNVKSTTLPSEALEMLTRNTVDAVVLDLLMPGIDGIETLRAIKKIKPHLPVIMLSAHGNIEKAVNALKLGAFDFLEKPVSSDKIAVTLRNAITQSVLEQEKNGLLETVKEEFRMIGNSAAMKEIHRMIERIAPTDSSVLITGENGTGKELVARGLHFKGQRAGKPFVPVNAPAIPENLLESELFGHEKGAFTGAVGPKAGLFEQADNGTLFFDEIAEMSLPLLPKLLRVLEYKEIQRVGGTSLKKVDVRILAATNKNLAKAIKEGTFREDLYYRIAVLTIDVPPLRKRKEDIPLLVDHFAARFCRRRKTPVVTFHPHSVEMLMEYSWPGNIRELQNLVEKVLVLSDAREILPGDIRPHLTRDIEVGEGYPAEVGETLEETRKRVEREKLIVKLHAMDWNYEKTAEELGISRATLFNKMKAYGITGKRKR